jgi:uroporphyrinogen decarboxylase
VRLHRFGHARTSESTDPQFATQAFSSTRSSGGCAEVPGVWISVTDVFRVAVPEPAGPGKTMTFHDRVFGSTQRLALPIALYPGLSLTGATVDEVVTGSQAQCEAQAALHRRYGTLFVHSGMDLSVEAEAFGCVIQRSDSEVPTVTGRLVTDIDQARRLEVPRPGDRRTGVYLETVNRLAGLPEAPFVFGGCIGPFSLAARLAGMTEALELTLSEPELIHVLLERCTEFLVAYVREFRQAGAQGVVIAEPAAGLLSPRGLAEFSSAYLRRVGLEAGTEDFTIVLHNCAARLAHLPAILETGFRAFHFGAPMDLPAAIGKVDPGVILLGNLDPAGVFCGLPPEGVRGRVTWLLETMAGSRNFVLSSGCDIPPDAPLAGLDAFYQALEAWNARGTSSEGSVLVIAK